jgi:hypothetical protein
MRFGPTYLNSKIKKMCMHTGSQPYELSNSLTALSAFWVQVEGTKSD